MIGPICAFLSSATWAVGSSTYSKLSQEYSPFTVNFTRAVVAFPIFILAAFIAEKSISGGLAAYSQLNWTQVGWFGLSMLASYALGDALFLWSTRIIGVPSALAIASAYPLWAALSSVVVDHQIPTTGQFFGLLITVSGVMAVIGFAPRPPRIEKSVARKSTRAGVILAALTSIFWFLNNFSVARGGKDLSPFVGNTVRMIWAMILGASLSRIARQKGSLVIPFGRLSQVYWIFVLEAFGGSAFFMYGLANSPAVLGAVLTSLAPVLSVPVTWALGLEKFSLPRTLGICTVVAGLWVLVQSA